MYIFCDIAYRFGLPFTGLLPSKMEFGNSSHASLAEYLHFTLLSVTFTQNQVEIYPEESSKPDVGNYLNRSAEITLYRVRQKNPLLSEAQKCLMVKQFVTELN